jgi:hypothetical protein
MPLFRSNGEIFAVVQVIDRFSRIQPCCGMRSIYRCSCRMHPRISICVIDMPMSIYQLCDRVRAQAVESWHNSQQAPPRFALSLVLRLA